LVEVGNHQLSGELRHRGRYYSATRRLSAVNVAQREDDARPVGYRARAIVMSCALCLYSASSLAVIGPGVPEPIVRSSTLTIGETAPLE
jgi:hypothetical protein